MFASLGDSPCIVFGDADPPWICPRVRPRSVVDKRRVAGGLTYEQCVGNLASVFLSIGRAVTIFALCCAIGLHWIALQSLAWTTMVIDYSKRAPLCRAITQTFDGAHPCSLCHAVNTGKNSEKKSDLQSPAPKIDMICASGATFWLQRFVPVEYAARDFSFDKVGPSPPVPPPRSLVG
jgi:hypothetical protein